MIVMGDYCSRLMDACTSTAIPFQDWTRNAPDPNTRSRAGSVTVRNCLGATSCNSWIMPDGHLIRSVSMIVVSPRQM